MSWEIQLSDLVTGVAGRLLCTHMERFFGIGTDTRKSLKGQVFFALKGDNFDAHDFLPSAVEQQAAALVVHRLPESAAHLKDSITIIEVDDTLKALQRFATFWRMRMSAKILGITGTNGKTTTKEFTAAIIGSKLKVQYSKGSFNNHWGVPLSLLSIEPEHDVAVIEMGMNHPGELTELVRIARPDAVVVTMVGRGHLEGVGSIEGAAKAKEEIYQEASLDAVRIFNLDNPHTRKMYERLGARDTTRILTFSSQLDADVTMQLESADAGSIVIKGRIRGGDGRATVPVFGAHNVNNLMVAASLALAVGMTPEDIWAALPLCQSGWGRNQWIPLESGARVLFDGYNANPESMRAAVENFSKLESGGKKVGVFGEMLEMGDQAEVVHRELGKLVGQSGFDVVCFVGPHQEAFVSGLKDSGFHKSLLFSDTYKQELALKLASMIDSEDIVVIKGSRGMQLERFIAEWKPLEFQRKS